MLRNYLLIAARNLLKHRLYTFINVAGLAIGIAACALILMYVRDELSYDAWVPDSDRIYRIEARFDVPGRDPLIIVASPAPAAAALKKDFAEIETTTRLWNARATVMQGNESYFESVFHADATFPDLFPLTMVAGDRALTDASSILLSETMAAKYFGARPALGGTLRIKSPLGEKEARVTGVFKDLPRSSNFNFEILRPLIEAEFVAADEAEALTEWTNANFWSFVRVAPTADVDAIRAELPRWEERNIPNFANAGQDIRLADFMTFSLAKLADAHLREGRGHLRPAGSLKTVYTFAAVALMILVIASINFTNLATARASDRAREVALRKVLGAHRRQLVLQFLGESLLLAILAAVLATAIVQAGLPGYNSFLEKDLALFAGGAAVSQIIGLIAIVGIVGGLYPAFYLSRFNPARILKANKSSTVEGSVALRSFLVVVQFAISIGLIICTGVVYGQTIYARTTNLGFNDERLMVVRRAGLPEIENQQRALMQELANIPGVVAVTRSSDVPTDNSENNTLVKLPGVTSNDPLIIQRKVVDFNFFSVMDIPLLAGRYLEESRGGDDFSRPRDEKGVPRTPTEGDITGNIVVNRAALSRLRLTSPDQALGQQIGIAVGDNNASLRTATMTIVGVVEDVNFRSVRESVAPMIFLHEDDDFSVIALRYGADADPAAVREAASKVWAAMVPSVPFLGEFMADLIGRQYSAEEAQAGLFAAFAGLAIIVACLGLFGLASFTADRRTREIGIRKVLGARVRDIVRLLAWDFSKPVIIANVLAWPVAWLAMRDWLNGFADRIDLNPMMFAAAGALALSVALMTVASHATRIARSNPIHALRYE